MVEPVSEDGTQAVSCTTGSQLPDNILTTGTGNNCDDQDVENVSDASYDGGTDHGTILQDQSGDGSFGSESDPDEVLDSVDSDSGSSVDSLDLAELHSAINTFHVRGRFGPILLRSTAWAEESNSESDEAMMEQNQARVSVPTDGADRRSANVLSIVLTSPGGTTRTQLSL
jgi:hypothetical protein